MPLIRKKSLRQGISIKNSRDKKEDGLNGLAQAGILELWRAEACQQDSRNAKQQP